MDGGGNRARRFDLGRQGRGRRRVGMGGGGGRGGGGEGKQRAGEGVGWVVEEVERRLSKLF